MRCLRLLFFVLTASLSAAATFTWSGTAGDHQYSNPANWIGGVVPPNNGTATLIFGNAQDSTVVMPFILDVAQVQFQNTAASTYSFDSPFFTILTVRNGISSSPAGGTERIGDNITLNLDGSQNINVTSGSLEIAGAIFGDSLVKSGAGSLRLSGFNLLSGNAQVDSGELVFSNPDAVPAFGLVTTSSTGYVGAENTSTLNTLIGQIAPASFRGSLGLDTAPGQSSPTVFSSTINVSNLTNFAGLGSSTSARLTGTIQLGRGQDYHFGGGAGTLYVESNLNTASANLLVNSLFGQPLTVVLRGSNNFGANSSVINSLLVLDSAQAITPGRVLNLANPGYIGATERFTTSTNSFLSILHATNPNAIAGLDSTNLNAPRTISDAIDLSVGGTRTDPYYLGTSSKVTLTGTITPTVGDALYLTAVKGGYMVVGSTLGGNIPGLVVGQANSFDPQGGIVEITGHNNYTGGTKILGGTLRVSNNAALGTGLVAVANSATLDISSGTQFSNAFSLASGARLSGSGSVGTPGGAVFGPGSILSPGGINSIGALTFNTGLTLGSGSVVEFDIGNLSGRPGTGWDLVNVNGQLNLTASSFMPVTIDLSSLTLNGAPGFLSGFDANQSYSWLFLSTGGVTDFSSDKFIFSTANFANGLNNGTFSVSQTNTGLTINFTPVPEPGTYVLFAMGLAVVAVFELRRRKK